MVEVYLSLGFRERKCGLLPEEQRQATSPKRVVAGGLLTRGSENSDYWGAWVT